MQLAYEAWIKEAPAGAKRTQAEFARLIGTKQTTVQPWLASEGRQTTPDGESLGRIAVALGVSGHWLLTGEGPIEAPDRAATEPYLLARLAMGMYLSARVREAVDEAIRRVEADGQEALRAARAAWASSHTPPPGPRRAGEGKR